MSLKRIRGATIVGDLVFTSGLGGGTGDISSQVSASLKKIENTMDESGSSFEHVIKSTVYLSNLDYRQNYLNSIWSEVFKDNRPSRTCVEVGLGSTDVEIEVVAVIPSHG